MKVIKKVMLTFPPQLEITQLTTERDQLVRQLEKSQDMLLSFQQVSLIMQMTCITLTLLLKITFLHSF